MIRCERVRLSSVITGLGLLLFAVVLIPAAMAGSDDEPYYQPGRLIFRLAADVPLIEDQEGDISCAIPALGERFKRLDAFRLTRKYPYVESPKDPSVPDMSRIYLLEFPEEKDVLAAAGMLAVHPAITWAEPDFLYFPQEGPNDPLAIDQHHLAQIYADGAWDIHQGQNGDSVVVIGITDTGVDYNHVDLYMNLYQNLGEDADGDYLTLYADEGGWHFDYDDINGIDDDNNGFVDDFCGWNFYEDTNNADEIYIWCHGSHVAGIAGGVTNNDQGIASISWNVKILVTNHTPAQDGLIYNGFDGVMYLINMGVDIINLSWGNNYYSIFAEETITYAANQGIIVVAGAGNDANDTAFYPACYPYVISVGAVNIYDHKTQYSNYSTLVDLCAPGGELVADGGILSTVKGGGYGEKSGTSMASPLVAGLLGLLKSYHPDWTREELIYQTLATTDDISNLNGDYAGQMGTGRINAYSTFTEENPTLECSPIVQMKGISTREAVEGEPEGSLYISVEMLSLKHNSSPGNATLLLTTDDESIDILDNSCTCTIPAEGQFVLEDAFCITVEDCEDFRLARLLLGIEADFEVSFYEEPVITYAIGNNGVLVFDGDLDGTDYSGLFISEYLEMQGLTVLYTDEFPNSLQGFDAVFLSFGNFNVDGSTYTPFTGAMASAVTTYLRRGGRVYLEGGSSLAYDQGTNSELLQLLGINILDSGVQDYEWIPLIGQPGSIAGGMHFPSSTQHNLNWPDRFQLENLGRNALIADGYGVVAVQHEGDYGQKSFCFSLTIDGLGSGEGYSNEHLLSEICMFFELPLLNRPGMVANTRTGNPPVTIRFEDVSTANHYHPILQRFWDFNSDGVYDSHSEITEYTYTTPGEYSITLNTITDNSSRSTVWENYIVVFNGESSLQFGEEGSCAQTIVPDLDELADAFTLDAWISPDGYGEVDSAGFGRIVSTDGFSLFLHDRAHPYFPSKALVARLSFTDGSNYKICTPRNSINTYGWQHVALTYDGASQSVNLFINGELQPAAFTSGTVGSQLVESESQQVIFGNSAELDRCFTGKIDEMRLWQTALDGAELQAYMDHALTGSEPNLAACWNLNEGCFDTIHDCSQQYAGMCNNTEWGYGTTFEFVGVEGRGTENLPRTFAFHAPYPNPFNQSANIRVDLPEAGQLSLIVYDVLGRKVATLHDNPVEAGYQSMHWNGLSDNGLPVASGMYFCRVQYTGRGDVAVNQVQKMILLR